MLKRKKLWIILTILIIIIVAVAVLSIFDKNCEITISAMIHLPPEAGINRTYNVYPEQEAEWSTKTHEAPFTPIRITNGNLKCSVEYGPIRIKGVFSRAEIKKIWPDAPIDSDWNFSIVLFNCHLDSVGYHMYCYVQVDAETNQCAADLYIFKNGFANPDIDHWEGKIGEEIVLGSDF